MKVYGMQHVGFTVPDLDEAVTLFTKLFGAVECLSSGLVDVDDEYMRRRLGVAGNTRIEDIRYGSATAPISKSSAIPAMPNPMRR